MQGSFIRKLKGIPEFLDMSWMFVQAKTFRTPPAHTKVSLGLVVEQNAKKSPHKPAVLFEGKSYTWEQLNALANRYARMLLDRGAASGCCAAIVMENRFEYLAALVGCAKIGVVCGLINIKQRRDVLVHSFACINSKYCIVGEECLEMVDEVREQLISTGVRDFIYIPDGHAAQPPDWVIPLGKQLSAYSADNLEQTREISLSQPCYYIFSSGTTGLPKAAVISHERWLKASKSFAVLALRSKPSDKVYVCLPLYHGGALHIGFGPVILKRSVMFLKRSFSASAFWDEVRANKINTFVYIGELCRYLLNRPEHELDRSNPITKCVGNGLNPALWTAFKERFQIGRICEFYASTEGNGAFFNAFNKARTIGFTVRKHVVVEFDPIKNEAVRDKNGICIPIKDDRPGLLLIQVSKQAAYEGYTDKKANESKLLRNVLKAGDLYFNSGDIIKRVDVGFAYGYPHYQFVDRIGDTFRWKGENVSTQEVSGVLSRYPQIDQCIVYGVKVPRQEGKAGMAAVKIRSDGMDWQSFAAYVTQHLPHYARPVFIRIVQQFDSTGTYKLQKIDLEKEGYHLESCGKDEIYVYKPQTNQYVELKQQDYERIAQHGI